MYNRLCLKASGMVLMVIVVAACGAESGATTTTPPTTTLPPEQTTVATTPSEPEIEVTQGTVLVDGVELGPNGVQTIEFDDQIVLQEGASANLTVPGVFTAILYMGTNMTLLNPDTTDVNALLSAGNIRMALEGDARLRLKTKGSVITTIDDDTVITVCQPDTAKTCLEVHEGSAELATAGGANRFEAGQSTFLNDDMIPSEAICIPDEVFDEWFGKAVVNEATETLSALVRASPLCSGASASTTQPAEIQVSVKGTDDWVDTDVNVATGDLLTISASGTVWHGRSQTPFGPNGNDSSKVRYNNVPGLEDKNHSALIGRIGANGKPFFVGESYEVTAEDEGRLFLGINDLGLTDNGGQFDVVITVK